MTRRMGGRRMGGHWPGWARRPPMLQGVLPIERSRILPDALAGLTLAALGIPEVLGYARIAGMPRASNCSTIDRATVVLPLPEAPRNAACVISSPGATVTGAGFCLMAG